MLFQKRVVRTIFDIYVFITPIAFPLKYKLFVMFNYDIESILFYRYTLWKRTLQKLIFVLFNILFLKLQKKKVYI